MFRIIFLISAFALQSSLGQLACPTVPTGADPWFAGSTICYRVVRGAYEGLDQARANCANQMGRLLQVENIFQVNSSNVPGGNHRVDAQYSASVGSYLDFTQMEVTVPPAMNGSISVYEPALDNLVNGDTMVVNFGQSEARSVTDANRLNYICEFSPGSTPPPSVTPSTALPAPTTPATAGSAPCPETFTMGIAPSRICYRAFFTRVNYATALQNCMIPGFNALSLLHVLYVAEVNATLVPTGYVRIQGLGQGNEYRDSNNALIDMTTMMNAFNTAPRRINSPSQRTLTANFGRRMIFGHSTTRKKLPYICQFLRP